MDRSGASAAMGRLWASAFELIAPKVASIKGVSNFKPGDLVQISGVIPPQIANKNEFIIKAVNKNTNKALIFPVDYSFRLTIVSISRLIKIPHKSSSISRLIKIPHKSRRKGGKHTKSKKRRKGGKHTKSKKNFYKKM